MKRYYFDHSATTRVDPAVAEAMLRAMTENFGNPSSVHSFGRSARVAIEDARETIAKILNCDPAEFFFTSGGTEADNLALLGVMEANRDKGDHLIVSKIEHHAVLEAAHFLERQGFRVSYLSPDSTGMIQPDQAVKAIVPGTVLISIMHINNEVGTINPIEQIGLMARERGILFHTDAVQSFGKIATDVKNLNVDLLSISAHKIYGPKGIGGLYARKGVNLARRTHGGQQEREVRTGTENLPGAIGLAAAAQLCQIKMTSEAQRLIGLRDHLWQGLSSRLPDIHLNGHLQKRLPGLLNISFEGIEGEALLLTLDLKGLAVSTGSACSSGQTSSSHVLLAMGIPPQIAQGSIRFSLGRENDEESVEYALEVVPQVVENLRAMAF